jgi:hypothetical protein
LPGKVVNLGWLCTGNDFEYAPEVIGGERNELDIRKESKAIKS